MFLLIKERALNRLEKKGILKIFKITFLFNYIRMNNNNNNNNNNKRTAVAQWLRCSATNRKVAGSIPAGVSGFFIDIKSSRPHYGPGVDSAPNRNEYQEYFLGVNAAGA